MGLSPNNEIPGDLSRRQLLAGVAGLSVAPKMILPHVDRSRIKPPALKNGDRVALIAPAGILENQAHVDKAIEKMASLGLIGVPMPNVLSTWGYFAGTDEQRVSDLNTALRDPALKAVVAIRGGYGATRILNEIDYSAMRTNPKLLLGFSDITALHIAFLMESGVVTFHSPCADSSWNPYSIAGFKAVCQDAPKNYEVPLSTGATTKVLRPASRKPGELNQVPGTLLGGNLTVLTSMVGTKWLPKFADSILFLEDIAEDPYRIDRMLTQLESAGHLHGCRAIAVGDLRPRKLYPEETPDPPERTFTYEQVFQDRCDRLGIPVVMGLPFGHVSSNHVIPLGIQSKIDLQVGALTFIESAVSPNG